MTRARKSQPELAITAIRRAISALSREAMLHADACLSDREAREDLIDARLAAAGRDISVLAEAARVLRRSARLTGI